MGSEWLSTVCKRSEVSFDVLGRSEAFLNVVMGSEWILKHPERSEALSHVQVCSEVFKVVVLSSSERSLMVLRHF